MRLVILFILMFSSTLYATDSTLRIAVNDGPPWAFYDETKGVTGIDVEIIRHIFNSLGYKTEFHLLGYNRLIKEFNEGKYDVASPAAFPPEHGYLTVSYLPFQDVAVSIKYNNLTLEHISDLKGKKIIAYQFASTVLGEEFAGIVKNANYIEMAERELQLKLLVNNRADVVVGERRLLTYIIQQQFPNQQLAIHPIFVTTAYGAIVKDPLLQQQFDQELAKLKTSGVYDKILSQWP
ncbi:polar amino acid ABC transporter [Arsukibacterium ikkense]|uniref:Polar amino acid ABC transporter n=1 Tax=Arsukibacterium ikkense TaxID=336831 RepID=A0A0M2V4X6_9GAMM|nr:transporter substrate-binding domain-containing protein [Arsukibacterium ikkense]KKO45459.1 polar amino acid ABC transporter [Arsukibacterium ikkense]